MNGGGRGESAFKCVCVCLGFLGVCIILVCGGICACQWDRLRIRVCVYYGSVCPRHPLLPGFTTEVNDLAVQSHSPVRAPSSTATGGLTN